VLRFGPSFRYSLFFLELLLICTWLKLYYRSPFKNFRIKSDLEKNITKNGKLSKTCCFYNKSIRKRFVNMKRSSANNLSYPDLSEFFYDQVKVFRDYYHTTLIKFDRQAIHQMRVAVKKINAVHKLKKSINYPITLRDTFFKLVKDIFFHSGKLRDVQLQHLILNNYKEKLSYDFEHLQHHINKQEKYLLDNLQALVTHIEPTSFDKPSVLEKRVTNAKYRVDPERDSIAFIIKKTENISNLLLLIENEDYVHKLRKQVKQLFFVLQFLAHCFPDNVFGKYDLSNLRMIGDRLGQWNDLFMFNLQINNFLGAQNVSFLEDFPEYHALQLLVRENRQSLLHGLDLLIEQELLNLGLLISGNAPNTASSSLPEQ